MNYLNYIANIINAAIVPHFSYMGEAKKQVFEVVRLARREKNDKVQTWPGQWDGNEFNYAGMDEDYDLVIYHRCIGITPSTLNTGGYGDDRGDMRVAARMSMVVFAMQPSTKVTADELSLQLLALMPNILSKEALKPLGFKSTIINVNDIVLNEEQVFNEEYRNVDYFVKPEYILMKINYTNESTLTQSCFNTCFKTEQKTVK